MKTIEPKYIYPEIKEVFRKLISDNSELTKYFFDELNLSNIDDYNIDSDLPYVDIGVICRYIVDKKLKNETNSFEIFFEKVEEIYIDCSNEVKNFIVVGLFEGIQNIGGDKIKYHFSFNKWLLPQSQIGWNEIIDFWEGKEWRIPKEARVKKEKEVNKILNKKK